MPSPRRTHLVRLLLALCTLCALAQPVGAQFTTVLNIPPDPDIGDLQSIGSATQVNLDDGGAIGVGFDAGASDGSSSNVELNILGGRVGIHFVGFAGSTVRVSGGTIGDNIGITAGSTAMVYGGEFRLDGELINGLEVVGNTLPFDLPTSSVLTGTLADGTPFAFSRSEGDNFAAETLTLVAAEVAPIGPAVVTLPGNSAPLGVRAGQTLAVHSGDVLHDHFNAGWGSTVFMAGGQVGENFEAVGADVAIYGGSVGIFSMHSQVAR